MFDHPDFDHHEQVVYGCDEASGLKAIIAIHNTHLGPALGGLRVFPYASDGEALSDVLRLSRGMSYKSALAGLPLGGGKAVIIADPRRDKTPALMRAMGRLVERLGGRYITAEDSGTGEADMQWIAEETTYVTGLRRSEDESGDPSPFTARGVFHGLQAAVRHRLGRDDLDGVRVAIQGVGSVGAHLARQLKAAGAELVISDIDATAVAHLAEELGAATLPPEAILDADVDVFAPCALGGAIDEAACRRLKAKVVAGAANNQLATPAAGEALHRRGILYAPDYVTNAGGVIEVAWQRRSDYDRQAVIAQVERIGTTLATIFERASREGERPEQVADRLAEERFRPDRPRAA
ncbi:Glu/Leu/Phe/Val family dehydrogenase [Bisbaumannia pacifica]|uniref:Glu/Leu/Phe/Val dehydrogenase n=1 Tax=Bisbaumannia pacifica TaxID=77098 RepID=A0A510X3N5_9GAMM|nr:Glu/Leu/Phe/Val dehydrogenase [Halomonas pacifica]MBH8580684.1 Glu/Leu/Phe/Val dehydrogenase [Halomonas pacifica]GEK46009.1 leucine dehydrogenase [Halomonas pacifica]